MKTAHQFARELLAGPDLPIFHFDPSRAGMDDERDTSVSDPKAEVVKANRRAGVLRPFITIVGDYELGDEPTPAVPEHDRFAIDLLMRDPETHAPLKLCRKPKSVKGGGFEVIVAGEGRKPKWRHVIRTEEV